MKHLIYKLEKRQFLPLYCSDTGVKGTTGNWEWHWSIKWGLQLKLRKCHFKKKTWTGVSPLDWARASAFSSVRTGFPFLDPILPVYAWLYCLFLPDYTAWLGVCLRQETAWICRASPKPLPSISFIYLSYYIPRRVYLSIYLSIYICLSNYLEISIYISIFISDCIYVFIYNFLWERIF